MFKNLLPRIREYKKLALVTPILMVGEVAMEVLIPFLMSLIVDNGIAKGDLSYVFTTSGLLVAASLLSLAFGVAAAQTASRASAGFAKNLRHDLFDKILSFSFSNIDDFSPSSLITRMTTDVQNVQQAFQMTIRICFRAPIMFIFAILMVIKNGGSLAFVFAVSIPVVAIGVYVLVKSAYPIFGKVFKSYDVLNRNTQENLTNIRTVKAYVREDEEIRKFNESSETIKNFFVKAQKIMILSSPLMMIVTYVCLGFLSYFGAGLIANGTIGTGTLMSVFSYTMQILSSLMMIAMIIVMFATCKASITRIVEVLETKPGMDENDEGVKEVKNGDISFEHVYFSYGDEGSHCLDDINLDIKNGETIGIMGTTGSGKSTLVSLIARLYDIDKGSLKIGGVEARDYNLKALRDSVAIVLQKNQLFSGTVRSNLAWGNENATEEEMMEALKNSNADFIFTQKDGLDSTVEQGGNNFSGGQKQRLCIARALLKKPKVIIFDDSTSAVDTATDIQIRNALKENVKDCTKIIISQRVSSIWDADQIVILSDGKIEQVGKHEELLATNEGYKQLWIAQQKNKDEEGEV